VCVLARQHSRIAGSPARYLSQEGGKSWVTFILDYAQVVVLQTAGMIIVAVAKAFNDVRRLLGAHKWSEFLHNPGPGNAGRVSRIYFCELNTDDKCSKEGAHPFKAYPSPLLIEHRVEVQRHQLLLVHA
jgi:hypothetical protein